MTRSGSDATDPAFVPGTAQNEVALLHAIIDAVSAGPDVEPLAAAVAGLITGATTTDVCFVHVLDDADRSLSLAGATPPFDTAVGQVQLRIGEGVTGWVAQHRRPAVIVDHKERDPRYVRIPALRGSEFTSMASVPMAADAAGLVGVLNVHTVVRREFTEADIRLLTVIGSLVAGAMHSARLHRRLVAREHAQERFTEQVITAQETERRRLAGDIHDGISQRLVSLAYHLDAAQRALPDRPGDAAEQVRLARGLADLSMDEARSAIGGLRPPVLDDLGLSGGLTSLARSLPQLPVTVDVAEVRLPEARELALYRIAQEALQNVVKHSGAAHARLSFAVDGATARLEIVDDGCGFHPDEKSDGYGMHSMTERAELVGGAVTVRSRPGGGTSVRVTLPLPAAGSEAH
ncbi:GAF domain-containing sensor histidine kinase [Pseudonocardia sp.]|uniref:GAF domain-containing sensor histidine kinase n=1 Tax=Pseudonocardia sp. TaxID=60912 RepID=UPI002620B524|nr:GAF domain-containing sensor histidine kinase [Pseudonocardia sp.]